jgi:ATP-binding cassette subfamily C protein LapB
MAPVAASIDSSSPHQPDISGKRDQRFLSHVRKAVSVTARSLGVVDAEQRLAQNTPPAADESSIDLLCGSVGLVAEPVQAKLVALRGPDCPCIVQLADGRWLAITEIAAQRLAVCLDEQDQRQLVTLVDLPETRRLWRLRPQVRIEEPTGSPFNSVSLWRSLLPSRDVLFPVVLATVAINVLALAIPLATMNILDRVIANAAFNTLYALAIGVCLSITFDFMLRGLRSLLIDRASARGEVVFANSLFSRVLGAKAAARIQPVGIQANAFREIEQVREYVNSSAIAALGDLPFVALFLTIIYVVAGKTVIVPLAAIPVVVLTMLILQWRLRRLVEAGFSDTANKNALAIEVLAGVDTVKNACAERWATRQWERAVASQLRHGLLIRRLSNLAGNLVIVFQGLTTIALLVYGVHLVTAGDITPGALFAANMLAGRCMGPLGAFAALISRLQQNRMALQSVAELANMDQERDDARQLLNPAPFSQRITFENVSFAFAKDAPPAVSAISLSLKKGERVGVIGGIGSGKSTLVRLLTAFEMPAQGQVCFDGVSTQHIDPSHLRGQFGILPQTPAFFRASLRDNVVMGREGLSDLAVMQALARSGAQAWVSRLPKGLDTLLGEGGSGLSSGQRQTLALARALVTVPAMIIMDEPTSHLDQQTEGTVQRTLRGLPPGTTLFLVTHSPSLLEAVDRLIVMDKGRILFDGAKADVLAQMRGVVEKRREASAAVPIQAAGGAA